MSGGEIEIAERPSAVGTSGRLETVVDGAGDNNDLIFSLNLAYARMQLGRDVLLVDCNAHPAAAQNAQYRCLSEAVARRHDITREWLAPSAAEDGTDAPSLTMVWGCAAPHRIPSRDLLEFLSVVVGLYEIVIVSVGALRDSQLLTDLLPISASVQVLATQDRIAIRATHAMLLEADPARRWRERINVVVERYDSSLSPTAQQISEVTGTTRFTPLPQAPDAAPGDPRNTPPWVLSHPQTPYSLAVAKLAAEVNTPQRSVVQERPVQSVSERVKPGRARKDGIRKRGIFAVCAYLAIALPCLLGTEFFFILGFRLNSAWPIGLAWANLIFDVIFLSGNALFIYLLVQRYLQQRAGISAQLKAVTEHSQAGVAFTDDAGIIRFANPVFRRLLNLNQASIDHNRLDTVLASRMAGKDPHDLLVPVGEGRATIKIETGRQEPADLALSAHRIRLPRSDLGWVVNVQDITASRAYRESSAISASALEAAADGILVVDLTRPDGPLIYVNKAFEEMTGYTRREAIGKNPRFLQGGDRRQPELTMISRAVSRRKPLTVTLRNYRKDGSLFWNQMRLAPVLNQRGQATHYVALQRDVTAQRQAADEMERLAFIDPLTSLPNRTRFKQQLNAAMTADPAQQFIVASIHLQRLFDVNTSAGYERADALLIEVSSRLQAVFPDGLIGRLAGGEFGLACTDNFDRSADTLLGMLKDQLQLPYALPGVTLNTTFAMGYTLAVGLTAETAMRQAAVATHEAKSAGLSEIRCFNPATEALIRARARMTAELHQSISADDFDLHYQPKVDLETGAMIGAEALIRWQHPVFGLQPPDRFVELAEQTGLIVELGAVAFAKAARTAAIVNRAGQPLLPISVNVSAFQLRQAGLLAQFEHALEQTGARPAWLTLELTESVFTENSTDIITKLRALRDLGYGLSIDDFGTGYSSLRYLQNFPLTEIKLDRTFVTGLDRSAYNRAIAEAVLTIGNGLGVDVIAEGIETRNECSALLNLGCRAGQGFLFSKPLPVNNFLKLVEEIKPPPWQKLFETGRPILNPMT